MSEKDNRTWYSKASDGKVSGPFDTETMRKRVVDGKVQTETAVSTDRSAWRPAAAETDLGFDCLVMRTDGSIEILGPFAREYLDRPAVMKGVPPESVFFVRSGTVGEAAAVPGSIGKTGAALVERVVEARQALRESEAARSKAESALRAKDLEFDAERQRLAAEISGFKAAELKLRGEIVALRAEAEKAAKGERRGLEAEAKLVDAEKSAAASESALRAAQGRAAAAEKELSETRTALAEARAEAVKAANAGAERDKAVAAAKAEHARELSAAKAAAEKAAAAAAEAHAREVAALRAQAEKAAKDSAAARDKEVAELKAEAEKAAKEAEKKLAAARAEAERAAKAHERELAAVRSGAEKSAKDAEEAHARVVADLRAAAIEAARRSDAANASRFAAVEAEAAAAHADADWLRARLADLLGEVERRFAPPAQSVPAAAKPDAAPKPAPAAPKSDAAPKPASAAPKSDAAPKPAPAAEPPAAPPPPGPGGRDGSDAPFVEAEAIDAPPPGFRRSRPRPIVAPAAEEARKPLSGMAALEDQLKDELRRAGAAQASDRASGSKFLNLFKRK